MCLSGGALFNAAIGRYLPGTGTVIIDSSLKNGFSTVNSVSRLLQFSHSWPMRTRTTVRNRSVRAIDSAGCSQVANGKLLSNGAVLVHIGQDSEDCNTSLEIYSRIRFLSSARSHAVFAALPRWICGFFLGNVSKKSLTSSCRTAVVQNGRTDLTCMEAVRKTPTFVATCVLSSALLRYDNYVCEASAASSSVSNTCGRHGPKFCSVQSMP